MKMLWTDIQAQYPGKWAILADREMNGADIVSAELIDICDDDTVASKKAASKKAGDGYWFMRTTTTPVPAYIHVENAIFSAKE